jgi:hypothetical protein
MSFKSKNFHYIGSDFWISKEHSEFYQNIFFIGFWGGSPKSEKKGKNPS